ncbi:MAG: hypothetical protein JW884_13615 [Deltaproteobacteria bacterium]|nr:hypothetical protein [Deltaproteobacteria bacterium]
MKIRKLHMALLAVLLATVLGGCERYERKVVPFKMPQAFPNMTEAAGSKIAARAFDKTDEAKAAFGFDMLGAGILAVQIVFDNQGSHPLEILPDKTYLIDVEESLWPILNADLAYDRIERKTELGEVAPKGAKSGFLAGTAGAIIGAAIGIVSGANVAEAAGKGAAIGAAAGLTMGGAEGVDDERVRRQIGDDLRHRTLERKPIPASDISHGFIFFPGEAKAAKQLRLTLKEVDTGMQHLLIMAF